MFCAVKPPGLTYEMGAGNYGARLGVSLDEEVQDASARPMPN
jgi:hypothetical protein